MSERLGWLDGWRGAACWLMLVYHLLFDLTIFGWMDYAVLETWPMQAFEKLIAFSFILCAGISSCLTHSNLRRGLVTLVAGGAVTAVSYLVGAPILFGVLQFLGCSMLLYAAVGRYVHRLPAGLLPVLWVVLFAVTLMITERMRTDARWLFWLGFRYPGFTSFDYFPMLPYFFLFLLGAWAGDRLRAGFGKTLSAIKAPGILTWPGKHALLIYLLHQPVLFGACALVYLLS